MAQAPAEDQRRLLDVASIDKEIARLEASNVRHPLRADLTAMINALAARGRDAERARTTRDAAAAELEAAEARSAALQREIEAKEAKLNSGEGLTSRDLLTLQGEIGGLRDRLEAAQEEEFLALEAVEDADAAIEATDRAIAAGKDAMLARKAELEDVVAGITAEQSALQVKRDSIVAELDPDLMRVYERARSRGGYSVIAMYGNGTTDAGLTISPVEVAQIKALPAEEIYLSEDYDCIVVRLEREDS